MEDLNLWNAFLAGDQAALIDLHAKYIGHWESRPKSLEWINGPAISFLKSAPFSLPADDAQEVAQWVFLELTQDRAKITKNFRAYLFTRLRWRANDLHKHAHWRPKWEEQNWFSQAPGFVPYRGAKSNEDISEEEARASHLIGSKMVRRYRKWRDAWWHARYCEALPLALQRLDPELVDVLQAYIVDDQIQEDAAAMLGIGVHVLRNRLHKALQQLRSELDEIIAKKYELPIQFARTGTVENVAEKLGVRFRIDTDSEPHPHASQTSDLGGDLAHTPFRLRDDL